MKDQILDILLRALVLAEMALFVICFSDLYDKVFGDPE